MKSGFDFVIDKNAMKKIFKAFEKKSDRSHELAQKKVGLQLLNNIINGSPTTSVVPPILTGRLRGSGSAFVGKKLIGDTKKKYSEGTPATSYVGKDNEILVAFNTPYAMKLHESPFNLGKKSQQSGDVGYKFVEKHLTGDKEELMQLYADVLKKEL